MDCLVQTTKSQQERPISHMFPVYLMIISVALWVSKIKGHSTVTANVEKKLSPTRSIQIFISGTERAFYLDDFRFVYNTIRSHPQQNPSSCSHRPEGFTEMPRSDSYFATAVSSCSIPHCTGFVPAALYSPINCFNSDGGGFR